MGQEQSHAKRHYSCEMYEKVGQDDTNLYDETRTIKRIANHGIAAVWSNHIFKDIIPPSSRTDFFYITDNATKRIFIGFGALSDGTLTNELCIFDSQELKWNIYQLDGVKPRLGSRAVILDNKIIVFGGKDSFNYLNEIITIDLETLSVTELETSGDFPINCYGCVIGIRERNIYVWGGCEGPSTNSLYILNLNTLTWHSRSQKIACRNEAAFVQDENYIYVCGSSKIGGLVVIDMENEMACHYETEGAEPLGTITNAGLVKAGNYLIFFGGRSSSRWSTVHALDIHNKTWFIIHIKPDGITVTESDGYITETGVFMIPRLYSMAISYDNDNRVIYSCLGSPMIDPVPLNKLEIGEAIGVMNLRDDLLYVLHKAYDGDVNDD